ncbi:hypothetical protein ACQYRI_07025 [Salmonella enterica]
MNFVFFKVDNLPHEKMNHVNFTLKAVELLRDGEIIATPGDIQINSLPFFFFCMVPTGFRKIEFRMNNNAPSRILCSAGYLKTGEYLVNTPEGEKVFAFNALNGLWTVGKNTQVVIDNRAFLDQQFTVVGPLKNNNRHISTY